MKFRHFALAAAILLCAMVLASAGAYLKYEILKPLDLYQDKSIFELPFLMYGDEYLRFMVENAEELKQMEQESTQPSTTIPSVPPSQGTTAPTQGSTLPSHSQTDPTDPTVTEPSVSQDTTVPSEGEEPSTTVTQPTTTPPTTTTTTTPPTTQPPTTAGPNFDFPDSVDDRWFDNTLFIGDSRVVGLRDYARSGNAEYFCDVGMNLLSYDDKVLSDKNFSNLSLDQLLSSRTYDKIIVNFGLNECGFNDYSFKLLYKQFLEYVKQKQPNAIIVLQGIMSVTKSKADTAGYFQPSFIQARSQFIQSLCDGVTVYYIDCNPYFSDENGYLYASLTNDGFHPTTTGYRHWRDWIGFALYQLGL